MPATSSAILSTGIGGRLRYPWSSGAIRNRSIALRCARDGHRCDEDRTVVEDLGVDPARGDDDERPELGVAHRSDEEFDSGAGLLLDERTSEPGPEATFHRSERGTCLLGTVDSRDHGALVSLVDEVVDDRLDDNLTADLAIRRGAFTSRRDGLPRRDRNIR